MTDDLTFRLCKPEDIEICAAIEAASYPADEAASLEKLTYRQKHAGDYFVCAIHGESIIGFVCGTRCKSFEHESMSTHVSDGKLLAIHSVVVAEKYRGKGFATRSLNYYVYLMKKRDIQSIVLLAKANLLAFYVNCGFSVIRPSPIVHGSEQWFDLELSLLPQCYIVDAFCEGAGSGNPAAVVLLDEPRDAVWMQMVAAEFNLSETAFVVPQHDVYRIQYFTPTIEVDLCGHATLASAAVLLETIPSLNNVVFHANKDVLKAAKEGSQISMEFPKMPVTVLDDKAFLSATKMVKDALRIEDSDIVFVGICSGLGDLFVEIIESTLENLGTDLNIDAFLTWDGYSRGVIVCSTSKRVDFTSRFFGPKAGIQEDPVTGSAHCALSVYFGEKLQKKSLVGRQISNRGGLIHCELLDTMVKISGKAITTVFGRLKI